MTFVFSTWYDRWLVPHRKHMNLYGLLRGSLYVFICRRRLYLTGNTYEPPRPVTGIALLFYMRMAFVTHRKHMNGRPRPVYGDSFTFLYVDEGRTSQETHEWAVTAYLRGNYFILFVMNHFCGHVHMNTDLPEHAITPAQFAGPLGTGDTLSCSRRQDSRLHTETRPAAVRSCQCL
jgi:hypothetical protein